MNNILVWNLETSRVVRNAASYCLGTVAPSAADPVERVANKIIKIISLIMIK